MTIRTKKIIIKNAIRTKIKKIIVNAFGEKLEDAINENDIA